VAILATSSEPTKQDALRTLLDDIEEVFTLVARGASLPIRSISRQDC